MYQLQNTSRKFNVFHFFKINIGKPDKLLGIIKAAPDGWSAIPANKEARPLRLYSIGAAQKYLKRPFLTF
jgi:hypothetical protein